MKSLKLLFLSLLPAALFAIAHEDTQQVTINVETLDQLDVEGAVTFTIPGTGVNLPPQYHTSSTISLTTNQSSRKVTVSVDAVHPGITLKLQTNLTGKIVNNNTNGVTANASPQVTFAAASTAYDLITNINYAVIDKAPLNFELNTGTVAGATSKNMTLTYTLLSAS